MFKKINAIRLILAMMIIHFSAMGLLAAEDKVGFIDPHKVLSSHPKYEALQKQLDEFVQKKSDEAKALAEKETDQAKRMEIIERARKQSGDEEMRLMNPLTDDINKIIETVAKSKGVTVVLDKVLIFYGGVDLTEDIVSGLKKLK